MSFFSGWLRRVRQWMDESNQGLLAVCHYLIWYAKNWLQDRLVSNYTRRHASRYLNFLV
ncbi:hypothetical protein N9C84_00780 [Desulfobacterales bacterium]|nr:hypothetical protein [Desulfobacterales bacterium]